MIYNKKENDVKISSFKVRYRIVWLAIIYLHILFIICVKRINKK